jgi:hypothetical protein
MTKITNDSDWDCTNLSSLARALLEKSGWSAGRLVSTENYRLANDLIEATFLDSAHNFLANVGDLLIFFPHFADPNTQVDCSFNAVAACDLANGYQIKLYEQHLGERLSVIGEMYDTRFTLLIAQKGELYAGYEYDLISLGETPATALNNLCIRKEFPVVEVSRELNPNARSTRDLATDVIHVFKKAGRDPFVQIKLDSTSQAEHFRKRYGGITIRCTNANGTSDELVLFSSLNETSWRCPKETITAIGADASPIGEIQAASIRLLMTDDGRVIGFLPEIPSVLWYYGGTGEEALNNIVLGRGSIRL